MILTDAQSKSVRDAFDNGDTVYEISKRGNVPYSVVWDACNLNDTRVWRAYAARNWKW